DGERPVIRLRDEVDRGPHERPLHHPALLEGTVEVGALEALDPRPEPDVHRRRVLRLKGAHPLEHPRDREPDTVEQELSSEEPSVQAAGRERALGHAQTLPAARASAETLVPCAMTMPPTIRTAPTTSHAVSASPRARAPMRSASGGFAYVYTTARVGP